MSKIPYKQVTQKSFRDLFEQCYDDILSHIIDDTDEEIEHFIIDSQTLDLRHLDGRTRQAVLDLDLRAVLSEAVLFNVEFVEQPFKNWVKSAKAFFDVNWHHPNFLEIFADEKSYALVLDDTIYVDSTSRYVRFVIERDAGVSLEGLISPKLSSDLIDTLYILARNALTPALKVFASELTAICENRGRKLSSKKNQKVKNSASFKDIKGAIHFTVKDERVVFSNNKDGEKKYKPVLDREIKKVKDSSISKRISNRDAVLGGLIEEYVAIYEKLSADNVLVLAVIGQDIFNRLQENVEQLPDDEKIELSDVRVSENLLKRHALFVFDYPSVRELFDDLERTNRTYQKLSDEERSTSWRLLRSLANNEGIFADGAKRSVSAIADAVNAEIESGKTDVDAERLTSLGLGALRGTLHTLGATVIENTQREIENQAEHVIEDTVSNIGESINTGQLASVATDFMKQNTDSLLQIASKMPTFFSWIKLLLDSFGQ